VAGQDAKARFSELLQTCLREGPQVVTRRGAEAAVLVPFDQWRRINQGPSRLSRTLLLTDAARAELSIPPRGRRRRRAACSAA